MYNHFLKAKSNFMFVFIKLLICDNIMQLLKFCPVRNARSSKFNYHILRLFFLVQHHI